MFAALGALAALPFGAPTRAEPPGATAQPASMTVQSGRTSPLRAGSLPGRIAFVEQATTNVPAQSLMSNAFETTGILQCVPYARFLSGIGLHGDAWTWWDAAAGFYARGNRPEYGAVLSFPGTERMPLGHVAVVIRVLGARKILIDHANWPNATVEHGAISHDIQVEDVSPANDWTEVRVQFGEGGPMGSVYPANGFIYGWTEAGVRVAHNHLPEDALWAQDGPGWRMLNVTTYFWALPPAGRKQAYAAAGVTPPDASLSHGRPLLVLGLPAGSLLNAGALVQPLGVNRLDVGPGARSVFGASRTAVRWATVSR